MYFEVLHHKEKSFYTFEQQKYVLPIFVLFGICRNLFKLSIF